MLFLHNSDSFSSIFQTPFFARDLDERSGIYIYQTHNWKENTIENNFWVSNFCIKLKNIPELLDWYRFRVIVSFTILTIFWYSLKQTNKQTKFYAYVFLPTRLHQLNCMYQESTSLSWVLRLVRIAPLQHEEKYIKKIINCLWKNTAREIICLLYLNFKLV